MSQSDRMASLDIHSVQSLYWADAHQVVSITEVELGEDGRLLLRPGCSSPHRKRVKILYHYSILSSVFNGDAKHPYGHKEETSAGRRREEGNCDSS